MSVGLHIRDGFIESDWGVLTNTDANPRCGLQPLMLVTGRHVGKLLTEGPHPGHNGGYHSVTTDGDRLFAHLDYAGQRTTWELFPAHFADGKGPDDMFIGRWPD
jgi:hypothetical protein